MLKIFSTLLRGEAARQEDAMKDRYAIELIDQKIREADAQLKGAKATLATLIQRERSERRQLEQLETSLADLTDRARQALAAEREDLASEAAAAIAVQEDEAKIRRDTLRGMESRILRLRQSVEAGHRRLIDLRQGAQAARTVRREQEIQARLRTTNMGESATDEAEELIARVLRRDDPAEQADILREINRDLNHQDLPDRMAEAGFGTPLKTSAADVLARLKSETKD